jgi:hypothetical protein
MVSTRNYNRVETDYPNGASIAQHQEHLESDSRNQGSNNGSSSNSNAENAEPDITAEMETKIQDLQDQQAFERNKYISQRLLLGVLCLTILIYSIIIIVINS